jgi:hypothetical protein
VPFKHHAKHRHHILKPRYRVTNGPEYNAALRRRGSLTVWFTDEAIAAVDAGHGAEPRSAQASPVNAYHGPLMTLGNAAAAHVRLIVWCLDCRR